MSKVIVLKVKTACRTEKKDAIFINKIELDSSRLSWCFAGAKPIIVRKVVRNGQPEETGEIKKDTAKSLETKTQQKNESMEVEMDKKEKPRLKPSIKPKVLCYLFFFSSLQSLV